MKKWASGVGKPEPSLPTRASHLVLRPSCIPSLFSSPPLSRLSSSPPLHWLARVLSSPSPPLTRFPSAPAALAGASFVLPLPPLTRFPSAPAALARVLSSSSVSRATRGAMEGRRASYLGEEEGR